MATFVYKAKKSTAETVTGQITAETEDEAIDLINQLGLLPVAVEARSLDDDIQNLGRPQKVKIKDIYVFSRQLANLLRSGVSILRGLHIIESQTESRYFKKVIAKMSWDIKNGKSFSDALSDFPHIFSKLYITMAHAGEESGNLQEMLVNVAIYQKKQEEVISKVKMALIYPLLMAAVGAATVYFILSFVLPKMAALFDNMQGNLPLPTTILLQISEVLQKGWAGVLLGALLLVFFWQRMQHLERGRRFLSRMLLKVPLFGEIILKTELSRFCRTLLLLLRSGIPILRAIEISIPILSNEVIKAQLVKCRDNLETGGSFGESLQESPQIPAMMGHLIAIGEESGNLTDVLQDVAEDYERETDEKIKVTTMLFEPLMIMCVGLLVGFIVFAMLLPIFEIDVLAS